jgi:hypothetical protein
MAVTYPHVCQVYTALEKLFHRANRRFKLSRNFKAWKKLTKDNLTEKITLHQVEIVNAYRMKKLIFSAWKSCTTFIETPTHSVLYYFKLETTAMFMRKRRIFNAWRKEAISEREEFETLSETWPRKVMSRCLQNWLVLCRSNWRQRGNLIMRFFRQIR